MGFIFYFFSTTFARSCIRAHFFLCLVEYGQLLYHIIALHNE